MSQKHLFVGVCAFALVAAMGCSAELGESESEAASVSRAELSLGDTGPAVQAVRERLTDIGYFPNKVLADRFPEWRPAVPMTSAQPDLFDTNLELAVRKFQANYGQEVTGTVDVTTRDALARPRCGHPDSGPALDPTNKFDILGDNTSNHTPTARWNKSNLTYKYVVAPSMSERNTVNQAFAAWAPVSHMTFTEGTVADITIVLCSPEDWGHNNGCPSRTEKGVNGLILGDAAPTITSGAITHVDVHIGRFSQPLLSIITHEFGHAIGLRHSGIANTVMFPAVGPSLLTDDDMIAARSLYTSWGQFPDGALDIAAGAGTGARDIWIIGRDNVDGKGSGRIYWWDSSVSAWRITPWGAASRIAVDNTGRPWIVNLYGTIFRLNAHDDWEQLNGTALDIGAGGGTVWKTGLDHSIAKWDESILDWHTVGGGATRIAVDGQGRAWVVNDAHNIFFFDFSINWWTQVPGQATDIGANGSGIFVSGVDNPAGGHSLFVWESNPSSTQGGGARGVGQWVTIYGIGDQMAANWQGRALTINSYGTVSLQN
jgi:peptidoglycan hydrolase-like protein with peptidoglycan-binding domain